MRYVFLVFIFLNFAFCAQSQIDINLKDRYLNIYAYDQESKKLAVFDTTNRLNIINLKEKRIASSIKINSKNILFLCFQGKNLYASFDDGDVVKFSEDFSSQTRIFAPNSPNYGTNIVKMQIKNRSMNAVNSKGKFLIYDLDSQKVKNEKTIEDMAKISAFATSEDKIYIACWDRRAYVLNITDGEITELDKLPSPALFIAYIKPIDTVIFGFENGKVLNLKEDKMYQISDNQIDSIAYSSHNLYFGDGSGTVFKTDFGFNIVQKFQIFDDRVRALFFDEEFGMIGISWNGRVKTIEN